MRSKSWLFVALGAVVVGVVVCVIAFGQGLQVVNPPQFRGLHDVTDIYYLLDAKLTELSQKLDVLTEATVCTKACLQRWEYKSSQYIQWIYSAGDEYKQGSDFQSMMSGMGQDGWELVAAWRDSSGSDSSVWELLFKRPLG